MNKKFVENFTSLVRNNVGITVVCTVFFVAGLLTLNQVLVYTPDSARYLAWSQSLAEGKGFSDNTTPEPSRYVVHAPLYSIVIAPTAWMCDVNVVPAKIVTILFGVALIVVVYWWSKARLGRKWGLLVTALLAANPACIMYSTQVLSDIPFAVCFVLFLMLMEREVSAEFGDRSFLVALATVIVCGLFMREVGLVLIGSCTVVLLLKKSYRKAFLILAVTAGFFALWYIRNDVIVAGVEHPALRNSQLFFRHLFTPSDVSIFGEFAARLRTNAAIYGISILQLPFMAETLLRGISTMAPSQFPISAVLPVMPFIYHAVLILTGVVAIVGAYAECRNRERMLIVTVFLAVYLVPILLYPINDARFLFPLLIIVLYWFVSGFRFLLQRISGLLTEKSVRTALTGLVFTALVLPGLAWGITYTGNNWRYGRSPLGFYDSMRDVTAYPALFARPIELAGAWIAGHTDSSTVLVSRWKELGLYTRGRKVLDLDPQTLVDPFETMLRDYNVHYIVTVVSRGGLREYEQLFAQSQRYHFQTVQRFADLEIVRVERGPADLSGEFSVHDSSEVAVQVRYARGIRALLTNRPEECEAILKTLPILARKQYPVVLNLAVAKEFAGELDVANTMFQQFQKIQQAGSIVQPAWYHLEIISKLRDAMKAQDGFQRAQLLNAVAAYYWILGFHNQALLTMDKSVAADSTFFPSVVFRAVYSLINGDTLSSIRSLDRARRIDPSNSLVVQLSTLLANIRLLYQRPDTATVLKLALDDVRLLRAMGLRENAIDGALALHARLPDDAQTIRLLVDMYYQKNRYAPALVYVRELAVLRPDDPKIRKELQDLQSRW